MTFRIPNVGRKVQKLLPKLQAVAETALTDRATVLRLTSTKTASGGTSVVITAMATDRPCRVSNSQRQAQERAAGGEIRNIKSRDIRFAWDEDVRDTDQIVVTRMNGATVSRTFEVLDAGDVSDMSVRVVQCKQIS